MSDSASFDGVGVEVTQNVSKNTLAVICTDAWLHAAAYLHESNEILFESVLVGSDMKQSSVFHRIKRVTEPKLVLIPSKIASDPALLDLLTTEEGDRRRNIPYRIIKSNKTDTKKCTHYILEYLRCSGITKDDTGQPRRHDGTSFAVHVYNALASVINFASEGQVQVVGALVDFLQSTLFRLQSQVKVNAIGSLKAMNHCQVPTKTLEALQIFKTEYHPLVASKGSGQSKEGVSLFSLLNRTKSNAGKERLRQWMMQPLTSVNEIRIRQEGVALFVDLLGISGPVVTVLHHLENLAPVDKIMTRIANCSANFKDYTNFARTLEVASTILETLQKEVLWKVVDRSKAAFVEDVLRQCMLPEIQALSQRISTTLDLSSMLKYQCIVIQSGVSDMLDQAKDTYLCLKGTSLGARSCWRLSTCSHNRCFF